MRENYDIDFIAGRELSAAKRHELAMYYLKKTAYDGITPEQLVTEYFLACDRIDEFMREGEEELTKRPSPSRSDPTHGYKLEDTISQ